MTTECDAPDPKPIYILGEKDGKPIVGCRCMICARCGHHTGNNTQGHYWSYCAVTKTMREGHFCCAGNCEYGGN